VLERDVISFLANEVRLDMAGFTEQNSGGVPQMQFGFWIVDGFYQSYEVADPEVQLKLRVERILGGQQSFSLQGKPDESFFKKISDSVAKALEHPPEVGQVLSPTRKAEIDALNARVGQLVDYVPPQTILPGMIRLRTVPNPDKVMSALDEATRAFESILLLDPDDNAAKMHLAACLLLNTQDWIGVERPNEEERVSRAREYFREVIATSDPDSADDARVSLASTYWGPKEGLKRVEMLDRFSAEASDQKARNRFLR